MNPETSQEAKPPSGSKLLIEFGPLLVFFAMNAWKGIYWATGTFMVALGIAIAVSKVRDKTIPPMTIFTGVIVLVFGGLTLWLQDDRFIKLKVTILNVLFGAILLFGMFTGRNLLAAVLGHAFHLDEAGWRKLTLRYVVFFFALAALNEAVWRNVSTDTWVTFKVFGLMGLTIGFTVCQVPLLQRHQVEQGKEGTPPPEAGDEGSTP